MAEYGRLEDLIDRAFEEADEHRRDHLYEQAVKTACGLLDRLMQQPPFDAALHNIQNQNPAEIVSAIQQLKAGNWGTVVDDLDDMLTAAHFPGRHARRTAVQGVARLLTADPTTLVGSDAARMFESFRKEVCTAQVWLGKVIESKDKEEVAEAIRAGVGGVVIAAATAAVAIAGAPVAIAGAAAVAAVGGAVAVIRVIRKQKWL